MHYPFSEKDRQLAVKNISIEYLKMKNLSQKYCEEYEQARLRCLMPKFYLDIYEKYEDLENRCLDLDISLGLLVKKGDYENIPEYCKAIEVG